MKTTPLVNDRHVKIISNNQTDCLGNVDGVLEKSVIEFPNAIESFLCCLNFWQFSIPRSV